MDVYGENILDHYRHPRGKRKLSRATVSHAEKNHSCGDELSLELLIENDTITEIGWQGTGCAISRASMSLLAEEYEGKSVTEMDSLKKEDMYELLGVPIGPRRVKCALLGLHTMKNALRSGQGKEPQSWLETVEIQND